MTHPKNGSIRMEKSNFDEYRVLVFEDGSWELEQGELILEEAQALFNDLIVEWERKNTSEEWKVIQTWEPE